MVQEFSQDLRSKLDRVAAYDASIDRTTFLARMLQKAGPTRAFAFIYRRLGPLVDPWLLRKTAGEIAAKRYGMPGLLLTTVGAKSGQRRESPLLYARDGSNFLVVGTNFGTKNHPAWTFNLLKNPDAEIFVAGETIKVVAQLVDADSFTRLWPKIAAVYGGYDAYLKRLNHRTPRLFRLVPRE